MPEGNSEATADFKPPTTTYYQQLGITETASTKELKRAYRAASKLAHPDLHNKDPLAHEKFIHLSKIYDTLSDPDKRKAYNEKLIAERKVVERARKIEEARAAETLAEQQRADRKRQRDETRNQEQEEARKRQEEAEAQRHEKKKVKLEKIKSDARSRGKKLSYWMNDSEGRKQAQTDLEILVRVLRKKDGLLAYLNGPTTYGNIAQDLRDGLIYSERLADQGKYGDIATEVLLNKYQKLREKGKLSSEPHVALARYEERLREQALATRYDRARFDMKESEIPRSLEFKHVHKGLEYQERQADNIGFREGWIEGEGESHSR